MKSKGLTYVLIVSVIAVWGIIFYRIFLAAGTDEIDAPVAHLRQKEAIENYQINDTAKLVLNYRDPFLGTAVKEADLMQKSPKTSASRNGESSEKPEEINWDFVKYNGFIVNPTSKRVVSIISINNTEKMLAVGETSEGVKLLSNRKDSVKISYRGKTKYIRLK